MVQDTNPSYWSEYTNLQHVKHALIREYLKGWFPKLGFWSGRIVYLDTHAGRGRHLPSIWISCNGDRHTSIPHLPRSHFAKE